MKKRIAIITGATGGVGKEFVQQLIGEVDEVWAVARNKDKLNQLENEISEKLQGMSVDLSDVKNLSVICDRLSNEDVTIQYLVNNAGTGRMAASTDFSVEEIASHISTHNTTMAALCNICIPYMEEGAHIINVASQSAFQPNPYINLYAASKAFTVSYSRALGVELESQGIVVTVVCPGWIKTELLQTEMNGVKVHFPHLAEPANVVALAIRDANKGKELSVYSGYVKYMQFLSKIFPHKLVMKTWMKGIKQYI